MCLTVPGRIVALEGSDPVGRRAVIDYGIAVRRASLIYLPEARVGDFVVVQAGFATAIVPEAEALEALEAAAELSRITARPAAAAEDRPPAEGPPG